MQDIYVQNLQFQLSSDFSEEQVYPIAEMKQASKILLNRSCSSFKLYINMVEVFIDSSSLMMVFSLATLIN